MPERSQSKAVELSCDLYLRLLNFYPKSHREEYGSPMFQHFRDQCLDAWAARRTRGLIVFWLRVLPDLLKTSVLEHLSNLNWRKSMLFRHLFKSLAVFSSIFAAVFLLTVLTSGVIAFLMPDAFRSTARIVVDENLSGSQQSASSSGAYFLQTEFKVIQSHVVLDKVIAALDLKNAWGKKYNNGQPLKDSDCEARILRNLELRTVRNTKVIEVSAFSDNPDEAARLANGVVAAYRLYRADVAQVEASRAKDAMIPRPTARMVTIIQPGMPELRPSRPNRYLILALIGCFFGSIGGAVSVRMVAAFGRNRNPTPSPAA